MSYTISNTSEGENIEVVRITENDIFIRQERRDTDISWPYWAFHADELPAGEVTFHFEDETMGPFGFGPNDEVVGPYGPAVSIDGLNWAWVGVDSTPDHKTFKYTNEAGYKRVYFSMYLGYRTNNFDTFMKRHKDNPLLSTSVLTVSENGANVPLIEIGKSDAKYHVLLTARHHACETSGSYVLEGFLEHILKGGDYVAENCMIHAVPFVDYDGVICGDPGNNRRPHNHNRDYADELYASVRAIKTLLDRYDFSAAIDFHGPVKWATEIAFAYKVELGRLSGPDVYWAIMRECFSAKNDPGGIQILPDINYPQYNKGIDDLRSWCSGYIHYVKGVTLVMSMETPYYGVTVATDTSCLDIPPISFTATPENQRSLGRRYAQALDKYCQLFVPLRVMMN
jgi:hypothetical protein